MKGIDFTYYDTKLSSKGYMIALLDSSPSMQEINTDSQRTFNSVQLFWGAYQPFVSAVYDDALTMTFSIFKNSCDPESESFYISTAEARELKQWLEQPQAHKLTFDDPDLDGYYWMGSFNITEVWYGNYRVGFNLTFTCDAPWGYQNPVTYSGSLEANGTFAFDSVSDENGYLYPQLKITCKEAGDLRLMNDYDKRPTVVKGCESGEVLTFSPYLVVQSSLDSHKVGKDFNFKFLRIWKSYTNSTNTISSSLACDYELTYTPIAKVAV